MSFTNEVGAEYTLREFHIDTNRETNIHSLETDLMRILNINLGFFGPGEFARLEEGRGSANAC
jgi:hypothetical protein